MTFLDILDITRTEITRFTRENPIEQTILRHLILTGKNPYWEYEDLTRHLRAKDELILSSIVHFYLSGQKVASPLAMEVFKKEPGGWKLYRQHMEGY